MCKECGCNSHFPWHVFGPESTGREQFLASLTNWTHVHFSQVVWAVAHRVLLLQSGFPHRERGQVSKLMMHADCKLNSSQSPLYLPTKWFAYSARVSIFLLSLDPSVSSCFFNVTSHSSLLLDPHSNPSLALYSLDMVDQPDWQGFWSIWWQFQPQKLYVSKSARLFFILQSNNEPHKAKTVLNILIIEMHNKAGVQMGKKSKWKDRWI